MLNSVAIMGRLTADPEVRKTPNDVSVCSFTIACDKDFKREGDSPNWIDCVAWRQSAEFIGRYFKKGSLMAITGSIQTRSYQDKNGNNRKATEVVVDHAYFAESKRSAEENQSSYAPAPAVQAPPVSYSSADASDFTVTGDADDDLPF